MIQNWNNKPATGFGAADDEFSYGSVQRVELFEGYRRRMGLHQLVGVMNRAATSDLRAAEAWRQVAAVLRGGPAPDGQAQRAADLVSAWAGRGGSRLDRDLDGSIDDPGAAVLDRAWTGIADAVLSPVLGPLTADLARIVTRDNAPSRRGSAYGSGWYGYVDKDLRRLLGRPVRGPFQPPLLRRRRPRGLPRVALGRGEGGGRLARVRAGRRSRALAVERRRRADRLPAGAARAGEHDALDQPADLPAGRLVQGAPATAVEWRAVKFEKWNALGNDYAIVEAAQPAVRADP